MAHAYPDELAAFVESHLAAVPPEEASGLPASTRVLLSGAELRAILSVAYQASLLREEERPVVFRLLVADPSCFPEAESHSALQVLLFEEERRLNEHEIRRLAPAASIARSLLGVALRDGRLVLWGIIHTGPDWLSDVYGGRRRSAGLPLFPTVLVTGPGRVAVGLGERTLGALSGGRVIGVADDVFTSKWLPAIFREARDSLLAQHRDRVLHATVPYRPVSDFVLQRFATHFLRRVVSRVRMARHGGTLIIVPGATVDVPSFQETCVRLKYRFSNNEARGRFRALLLDVLNHVATRPSRGTPGIGPEGLDTASEQVDWEELEHSRNEELSELEGAVFELAHFIATLTAIDGVVVLTQRFELVGFGGEINGKPPPVNEVFRALDLEGTEVEREATDGVGTRHRSVYRLCGAFPDILGIVVSQDGAARFVRGRDGAVTYWDQIAGVVT